MFLKVSLVQAVVRFRQKKRKLSSRYIGPFEILECVGKFAYRLAMQSKMFGVHSIVNVNMLRKYIHGATHMIDSMTSR